MVYTAGLPTPTILMYLIERFNKTLFTNIKRPSQIIITSIIKMQVDEINQFKSNKTVVFGKAFHNSYLHT